MLNTTHEPIKGKYAKQLTEDTNAMFRRIRKTQIQKLFGCAKGKISYESDKIFHLD